MTIAPKIDFLDSKHERAARRTTVTVTVVFTLLVGAFAAIGAGASYRSAAHGTNIFLEVGNLPVITNIRKLVLGEPASAQDPAATPDGRMNVMLFGVGGAGHDGSQLTDTIILASVDAKENRVGLLSIPRDMAYPLDGARFEKINAVNAYAEQEHPGEGAVVAAKNIGKLLGVRVDHVVKIDFRGFEKFVDALGGLDINVERGFVDNTYPTDDDLWQTVTFTKGMEHMNGSRALIYTRSRHGTNGEGSDFARSRRQQIIITAIREKLLSRGILTSPTKIAELWNVVSSHIQTDLSVWDLVKLASTATHLDQKTIVSNVISENELVAANVDGAYMLFPRKPDWSQVREIAQNPFETPEDRAAKSRPTEEVRVEIKNGTTRTGYAGQVSDLLKKQGYIVTATGNAVRRGYERSVIFDLTNGAKPLELARLKNMLDANVSTVLPAWLTASTSQRVVYAEELTAEPISATSTQFLVILGESSLALIQDPSTP